MGDTESSVFGYFFKGEEDEFEEFHELVDNDPSFQKREEYPVPVYDSRGSRVVLYPRSSRVRLLQKDNVYEENMPRTFPNYNVEDHFELEACLLKASEEDNDWICF